MIIATDQIRDIVKNAQENYLPSDLDISYSNDQSTLTLNQVDDRVMLPAGYLGDILVRAEALRLLRVLGSLALVITFWINIDGILASSQIDDSGFNPCKLLVDADAWLQHTRRLQDVALLVQTLVGFLGWL